MSGKTPIPLMLPVSWLLFKSSWVNFTRLRSSGERLPESWLKSRSRKIKFVSLAIEVGIVDVNPPRSIPQMARSLKCPISSGMVPMRLFSSVANVLVRSRVHEGNGQE